MRTSLTFIAVALAFAGAGFPLSSQVHGQAQRVERVSVQRRTNEKESGSQKADRPKPQPEPRADAESAEDQPQELLLFIANVRSAPPEFAADLLLRLVESDKIADPAWKSELIEEAFRLAPAVQQPVKRLSLPSVPTDTRAGFLAHAFGLDLDALSLQCRSVSAMLQVDKVKARNLFAEVARPQLPPLECKDSLAYDVSSYYRTLKRVADGAFSKEEVAKNEPTHLIESAIGRIVSPAEVAPALNLVASFETSPPQRALLVAALAVKVVAIAGDDRSFTSSLSDVARAIGKLASECAQKEIATEDLLRAYRSFLINHLGGARCADNSSLFGRQGGEAAIRSFNDELRRTTERPVPDISAEELKLTSPKGTVAYNAYWRSPKASTLLKKLKRLRFGSGRTPLTVSERQTLDWQNEMEGVLKYIADWGAEDQQSEEDYFHQKCISLRALLELAPDRQTRGDLIKSYVEVLSNYNLDRGSRIEWAWQAGFLFKDIVEFNGPAGSAPSQVIRHSDTLSIVDPAKNPVLYLYLQAEKLMPQRRP